MFDKFKELFSSESLLDEAFETTLTMLEFDLKMFNASRETLRESDTDELPFDIKKTDRRINKYQREVRRKVLSHLTVAGTSNLVPGLALISIVIDVERIGDYTKNIADLATKHKLKLGGGIWEEEIKTLEERISLDFSDAIKALADQDKTAGRRVMKNENETGKAAEKVINEIIAEKDKKIGVRDATALALYTRYLKRINAHLTNIASAVVNPFPRIGFRAKKRDMK